MKRGNERICSHCGVGGHSARRCQLVGTRNVQVPAELAEVIWYEQLSPIWKAASYDSNPVRSAMLSAYLQGALDGVQLPAAAQGGADGGGRHE
jgi:hypothetical protein